MLQRSESHAPLIPLARYWRSWLKDSTLGDGENLPEPEVLAAEIVEDLQTALEAFQAIVEQPEVAEEISR